MATKSETALTNSKSISIKKDSNLGTLSLHGYDWLTSFGFRYHFSALGKMRCYLLLLLREGLRIFACLRAGMNCSFLVA